MLEVNLIKVKEHDMCMLQNTLENDLLGQEQEDMFDLILYLATYTLKKKMIIIFEKMFIFLTKGVCTFIDVHIFIKKMLIFLQKMFFC